MGCHHNIGYARFPKQGNFKNQRVNVCFNYNLDHTIQGTIVRDDSEAPFVTIIQLDDGRFVLTSECQWQPCSFGEKS